MNIDDYFAMQDKKDTYVVDGACCVGCGRCKMTCPEKAIRKIEGIAFIDPEICLGCGNCMPVCPVGAIEKM